MLGIADEHVLREAEAAVAGREISADVEFRYNHTTPGLMRGGIDVVWVSREADDRYRVEYWGYLDGTLVVTRAGVEQLGEHLVGDRPAVPAWLVASDREALPDWLPDSYEPPSPVACEECGDDVAVTDVRTPPLSGTPERVCKGCWER